VINNRHRYTFAAITEAQYDELTSFSFTGNVWRINDILIDLLCKKIFLKNRIQFMHKGRLWGFDIGLASGWKSVDYFQTPVKSFGLFRVEFQNKAVAAWH